MMRLILSLYGLSCLVVTSSCSKSVVDIFGKVKPVSSPCNTFDGFVFDSQKQLVGDTNWPNGCSYGRYMTGVWSRAPTEPFEDGKCCGSDVESTFSWELSNLQFYTGGSQLLDQQWNIECTKHTAITGFRFMSNKIGLTLMSSVRCSLLIGKVVDKAQCVILDFARQSNSSHAWNETWTHECPAGYVLSGVYDDYGFLSIKKGKCCRILDNLITVGWTSAFQNNLAGFRIGDDDDFKFQLKRYDSAIADFILESGNVRSSTQILRGSLLSPGIGVSEPTCLSVHAMLVGSTNLLVYMRTNSSTTLLQRISEPKGKAGTTKVLVKPSSTYQLELVGEIVKGAIWILKIEYVAEDHCDVNRCTPVPLAGCGRNQICRPLPPRGLFGCACMPGFEPVSPTDCAVSNKTTQAPSSESSATNPATTSDVRQKNGGDDKDSSSGKGHPFTTGSSLLTASRFGPDVKVRSRESPGTSPPWLYVLAGVVGSIALALVCVGSVIGVRNRKAFFYPNRRHAFSENAFPSKSPSCDHVHLMSMDSMGSSFGSNQLCGYSNSYFYRPFMQDIGIVENLSPARNEEADRAGTEVAETAFVNPDTPEPVYTKIKRSASDSTVASNTRFYRELEADSVGGRRDSCATLLNPVYEGEDSRDSHSSEQVEPFFVPGDTEEELLEDLQELNPNDLIFTTEKLGEGAFGVVKLGTYVNETGAQQVAIKVLKQRAGFAITEEDRIRFYQEAVIVNQFEHRNIVSLIGVVAGPAPTMVLEYLSRGNLQNYLMKIRRTREHHNITQINRELHATFLRWAREIVSAMEYLERMSFIHRDLATRNILLNDHLCCKICDFGLARQFLKEDHYYTSRGGIIPVKWTAPEALQFKKYSCASDIWSYGVVLWEIWSIGRIPYSRWSNERVIIEVCDNRYRLESPRGCPKLLCQIMLDCWNEDKHKRPTFAKLRYCLSYSDERILGKRYSDRNRSVTFSSEEEETVDPFLENLQCPSYKTE